MKYYSAANTMTEPPALTEIANAIITLKKILNSGVYLPEQKPSRDLEAALKVLTRLRNEFIK